jgi:hypothetical protein
MHEVWRAVDQAHQIQIFFITTSPIDSLPTLLLFDRNNFSDKVMLQLIISLISSQLFGTSLTLLVFSCHLSLMSHARIRRLLLNFVTLMTS